MHLIHIGLDIGSTTVKTVFLEEKKENSLGLHTNSQVIFRDYRRHYSQTRNAVAQILQDALSKIEEENHNIFETATRFTLSLSGSGAIALAEELNIDFVQEVIASTSAIQAMIPQTDVCIELGGEDAKIIFLKDGIEQRMNEACAGGTGAFIDQMAEFLHTDALGLNELAKNSNTIYPIASRCGVFAKTDILPLLNEGTAKENIALSIFQAVVDQVIGGLACGREVKGKIAFLGGPLTFLSMLRERFAISLKLTEDEVIFPENSQYYVALGAALHSLEHCQRKNREDISTYTKEEIQSFSAQLLEVKVHNVNSLLPPLFIDEEEKENYIKKTKEENIVKEIDFDILNERAKNEHIPLYLGIDAGSTTVKAVLFTQDFEIVYSYYASHTGEPLDFAYELMKEIYAKLPNNVSIVASGATGYGAHLIKTAFGLSLDEVETMAHFKAARFFLPNVSYILDIGGQDIKCMQIQNSMVQSIKLNEACSAGCGSFIENFAKSLNISLEEFIAAASNAHKPVDLGTRCTVFMNSKVKQAQKEGYTLEDIAAGLSYSVIKNALYKVIRISGPEDLGDEVMVQGGAFYNVALLRALEIVLGKKVTRMSISGLMGAFGAALIAKEHFENTNETSKLLSKEEMQNFKVETKTSRCKKCTNHCLLTIVKLQSGKNLISGNRCDKGLGDTLHKEPVPNMFHYKYQRLFEYYVPHSQSSVGTVGIPRTLNMYENYPFWFSFFHELGFRVELSAESSKSLYNKGISTIPSQALCYPAKLAHGHLLDLIQKNVDYIFYPCILFETQDFHNQDNNYNCPIVAGYPELLLNNISVLREKKINFYSPFLSFKQDSLCKEMSKLDFMKGFSISQIKASAEKAFKVQEKYKLDIRDKALEYLSYIHDNNKKGIVLAGHPYHLDPEIHHGIPELISSMGIVVLTEDSIAHLGEDIEDLSFIDQWTYHARLYRAAHFVAKQKDLAFIQLVSFGCGLDAITAEQVEEILLKKEDLYTQIKIDEGFNLGAARIRIRSLLAVLRERENVIDSSIIPNYKDVEYTTPSFTKEMKESHTILIPQMAPLHFNFLEEALNTSGYKAKLLPEVSRNAIEYGLKYVNNDACYPAITVIGQLMEAIQTQNIDTDKVALLISQTGGSCRATNYVGFLKKALLSAGLSHIPIITFNISQKSENPGFVVDWKLFSKLIQSVLYGDVLMRLSCRTRPYESVKGATENLLTHWNKKINASISKASFWQCYKNIYEIIKDFNTLKLKNVERKPRVGIVGEILLKFHPDANNRAVELIEAEGGEVTIPDLYDFFLYTSFDSVFQYLKLGGSRKAAMASRGILLLLLTLRLPIYYMLKAKKKKFGAPLSYLTLQKKTYDIVSLGQQAGEGWLLTAEMVELIESKVNNILCMQPFGCLPNHITGRGVIKEIKRRFPQAHITAVDYDASTSETNQINRIKLIMALASK